MAKPKLRHRWLTTCGTWNATIRCGSAKRRCGLVYRYWYAKIVSELSRHRPIIELGCGCGNFKQFCPEAVSTDVFATPWCEQVVDAQHMPFEDASVGNLVLVDVLHHVPTPLNVIGEANRVLTGGGRMIILEPYISLWS